LYLPHASKSVSSLVCIKEVMSFLFLALRTRGKYLTTNFSPCDVRVWSREFKQALSIPIKEYGNNHSLKPSYSIPEILKFSATSVNFLR